MDMNVIAPVYADRVLPKGVHGFGLLLSAMGAGSLVGALRRRSCPTFLTGSTVAWTPSPYPAQAWGLAIAQEAVKRMGGALGAESEAGQGSRFSIRLPLLPVRGDKFGVPVWV